MFDEAGAGPLPRGFAYHATSRGLRRLLEASDEVVRTKALSLEELFKLVRALDPTLPNDLCFGSQLLLAFVFALRTEDHCTGKLRWGDIIFERDGSVSVFFPPGKNSRSFRKAAACRREDDLDLSSWLRALAAVLPPSAKTCSSPVFVSFEFGAGGVRLFPTVTSFQFIGRFRSLVRSVLGKDPTLYAGYSLRRGAATEFIKKGVPLPVIKAHVGWSPSSTAIFSYYDHGDPSQMKLASEALV